MVSCALVLYEKSGIGSLTLLNCTEACNQSSLSSSTQLQLFKGCALFTNEFLWRTGLRSLFLRGESVMFGGNAEGRRSS